MADIYNLERFKQAQGLGVFERALEEVQNGRKTGHWIWFIFPQMRGFGSSYNTHFYGITCADEARAYLADPVLGDRLRTITQAFLSTSLTPFEVFGHVDTLKLRSCMTLFDFVSPNDLFGQVLDAKFEGERDLDSLELLQHPHHQPDEPRKSLFNPNN